MGRRLSSGAMDTPSTAASDPPATTPLEVPPRARVSTLPPRGAGPPPPTPPRPPTLPPTLERVSTESPPATGPEDVAIDALAVFPGERTPVYDQEGSQDTTAPVTDRAQAVAAKNGTTTSKCCCAMPMGADRPTAQLPTVDFAGRFNVKGVPAVFQNVGCTGFSDTESVYLGGSKQGLPSLAMGFAYDFEPRAFGYPSEQLGHPTPAQCCAAMPCVSCVGQMCEPAPVACAWTAAVVWRRLCSALLHCLPLGPPQAADPIRSPGAHQSAPVCASVCSHSAMPLGSRDRASALMLWPQGFTPGPVP